MFPLPAILGGDPVRSSGPPPWPSKDPAIQEVLAQSAADGSWGRYHGPHCETLIHALQELHAAEYVILTCSGTVAVELALRGAGIRSGSEVILAAYDFKANFTNVALLDAKPVLVDCQPNDGQIDIQKLASALSEQTAAILVSHLHGHCVDMPAVRRFADEHGIPVIEDACQMPGAQVAGRVAGMWGDVATISFGGSKTLTAGRGGAVITNRAEIAQRIRLYTQRGNDAYPLSEIQAALLLPQVKSLNERRQQRSETAEQLRQAVQRFPCLRPFTESASCEPDYYKFGFFYDRKAVEGLSREQFCQAMRAEGVPLDPGFRALHKTHARSRFRESGELSIATMMDDQVLVLHHPFLLSGPQGAEEFALALDKISAHATLLLNSSPPAGR